VTKGEAISRIKDHMDIHFKLEYPKAIKITEALVMAIEALKNQDKDRWIPVSECMPEEHEESRDIWDIDTMAVIDVRRYAASDMVLVTVKNYDNDTVFTCDDITVDGKWCNFNDDSFEVIAWKPMPDSYKEV
jgi:hypothetical protein